MIFQLVEDDSDDFDTRRMALEIRERSGSTPQDSRVVASGHGEMILNLMEAGDKIIIALGAECYDRERRVVHPRGVVEYMAQFVADADKRGAEVRVCVLAEPYKCHKDLSKLTEFYEDHFDRVTVYNPESIDMILDGWELHVKPDYQNLQDAWERDRDSVLSD